jgi:RHS repeat-associated protein
MHSRRPLFASRLHPFSNLFRQVSACGWRRRALCLVLILCPLIVPDAGCAVSAATEIAVQVAKETVAPVPVAIKWFKRLFHSPAKSSRRQTTADRNANVTNVRITPARIVGYQGQQISFSAIGRNVTGQTIQGVQFTWSSSDANKLQIDSSGSVTLSGPGVVWVSAATSSASSRVPVLIMASERPVQTDSEWQADQEQLQPDGTVVATPGTPTGSLLDSIVEHLTPTAHAQTGGGDSGDFLYDELWSEPRNLVGSPRHRVMTSLAIGSVLPEGSNFEFSVPIYGLSGRGVSESIALNYNSRVWSRHGSAVTFNAVNSWPYLGFNLSFGRIVTYPDGSNTKVVLIDSDGTRHYLGSGPGNVAMTFESNDGSHISFFGKVVNGGTLHYNNGVEKKVSVVNNRLLVTRILDPNGNYISIAYKSQTTPSCGTGGGFVWKQAIDTITDTLGRVIQFNYDTCNNLVSIDVPGYGGTATSPVTTTIARFDYLVTSSVSTSFSGLTVENVPSSSPVVQLSHVYYPTTTTGYKFTHSAYGMVSTVSQRKDMSYNSSTGVISDGTEKACVSFNYPASGSSLTDAPSFSQWTQSPAATSGGTATWSFTSSIGVGTKIFTITNPDSSTMALTRAFSTISTAEGLLTQSEVKTSGGTSMAKSVISYTTDGGGQPQVASVISYDDATPTANQTKVDYDYDSYGNITNMREYGFQQSGSWVVRQRTHNVYKTDTSYVTAYLRNLVIEKDLYNAQLDTNDANDVLVAKTTYTYDDYGAMGGMENYGGTTYSVGHLSSYDTTATVRGNITGTTRYADVSTPTTITHLRKIDIFGNAVKEQLSCCNQGAMNTDDTNGYLMPVTVVKGDQSGVTLTTMYESDFNTSLQMGVMDPNGRTTTVYSRDAALRPTQIDLPTGATQTASYNDSTQSSSRSKSYDDDGTTKTVTLMTDYDGWGRIIHQTNVHGGQVNTSYDNMGRVASTSNPFTVGGSPSYSTSYTYDALGRQTITTLPDSQTVTTTYNGNRTTFTDQVNRKMQQVTDGLGQLVTVNEQDSSGNLTQATNYSYDVLSNLTQVDQGGQSRSYKYDALSRLLYEKIPEQAASINDGTGTLWTCKYTYTDFNAIATKTDARGVVTTNTYDTLNRLTQVSYNTVSGVTTAPTITYTYDTDTTYSTTADGKLLRVNVGSDYQERYTFDSNYRIASAIFTIGTQSYTTSFQYNEANQPLQVGHMTYEYDSAGRLSSVGGMSNIAYNVAGQVTGDRLTVSGMNGPIGTTSVTDETFGYDAARLQLTSQTASTTNTNNPGTCIPSCPPPPTGGTNMSLTHSYSASAGQMGVGSTAGNAGQLMSVSGTIGRVTESAGYTYDNYGRLVTSNQASNGSSAQRRFAYDRWGNRTGVWDATSGGTQIQSVTLQQSGGVPTNRVSSVTSGGTVSYAYDANGNVTNDGAHSYTYDSENRLLGVDSGAASYAYDHQNRRYKKTVGATVTHYIWNEGKVLGEYNGSSGALQVAYWYGGGRLFKKTGTTTQVFLSDQLSVRLMLSDIGAVAGRQAHLPFGEDFAENGTQQKQHFTSYERDSESGTDYAINRQYSPGIGRFNRPDPYRKSCDIKNPQTLNRYAYSKNDAINKMDPLGLAECESGGTWDPVRHICVDDQSVDGGTVNAGDDDSGFMDELFGSWSSHTAALISIGLIGAPAGEIAEPANEQEGYGLNPCEKKLYNTMGELGKLAVYEARREADKWDKETFPDGWPDGSWGNAVKHCMWNCLMTRYANLITAQRWGEAHECDPQGNPQQSPDSKMDRKNNALGQKLAGREGNCQQLCAKSSHLTIIREPFEAPVSAED